MRKSFKEIMQNINSIYPERREGIIIPLCFDILFKKVKRNNYIYC